jgi:poly-gamma-glutamate system protein
MRNRFVLAGGISLLAWILLRIFAPGAAIPWTPAMQAASERMHGALEAVAEHCREAGIQIDPVFDPNRTCLIGPEHSELFTSLGQLEAKRTTTNPEMAGLMVHLLGQAGVGAGDRVAIGASGSFPALLVATLAAVEAIEAEAVPILSLGASSFGATRPDFHLWDLYRVLEEAGFASGPPAAVSLGGSGDVGGGFDRGFRDGLLEELRRDAGEDPNVQVLEAADLRANVTERMGLYGLLGDRSGTADATSGEGAAFVNVGGAFANLGTSPEVLNLPPGLVVGMSDERDQPLEAYRGVLYEMASRGVPVVHLLHIRGLALRYGLPWDPLSLPDPGTTRLADAQAGKGLWFWLLTIGYLSAMILVAIKSKARDPVS